MTTKAEIEQVIDAWPVKSKVVAPPNALDIAGTSGYPVVSQPTDPLSSVMAPKSPPMLPELDSPPDQNIADEADASMSVQQNLKRPCESSQGPRKKWKATNTNINVEGTLMKDDLDKIVDVVTTAAANQ